MVELTHNKHRYMVDGGNWFRRLEVGEVIPHEAQFAQYLGWASTTHGGYVVGRSSQRDYRVPCTDPRPPFVVGQRVKVARLDRKSLTYHAGDRQYLGMECEITEVYEDGSGYMTSLDGWSFAPWCLDAVTESEQDGYTSVPLEKVGEVKVKFQEAVPLPPRTMGVDEDDKEPPT